MRQDVQPRAPALVRLAFVLGPLLLGALLWLSEQMSETADAPEGARERTPPVVAAAPPPPPPEPKIAAPPPKPAAPPKPAEAPPPKPAAETKSAAAAPPKPVEIENPPPAAPAPDWENSISARFADATSDLPPPVAWYAPVAAVPAEPQLAVRPQAAVIVVPPASDGSQFLVRTLAPSEAEAIVPLRIAAPPPLRLPDAGAVRDGPASDIVEAPPGTPPSLTGVVDPGQLHMLTTQGAGAVTAADDMLQAKGLRLVRIAAALGHAPARTLIAREFPRSRVLRLVVPASDAVRYALDGFTGDAAAAGDADGVFMALAGYFAERQALSLFAGHLLDAIYDDRRLQDDERLQAVFAALATVSGGCTDLMRLLALPAIWSAPGCPPALRLYAQSQARAKGSPGRDAASRRQALSQLQALAAAR